MKTIVVIPAHLESKRLPRKLLLEKNGKPLLIHTWESVKALSPIVATDSEEIIAVCQRYSIPTFRTGPHSNGTSRMAELAGELHADVYVNVQADEPQTPVALIDLLVANCLDCATAYRKPAKPCDVRIKHSSWLVEDFSRTADWPSAHVGIYAYRRGPLLKYAAAKPSGRELSESLEQLRALHLGFAMSVVPTDHAGVSINTPEDYEAWRGC